VIALASIERDAVIVACAISASIHAALTPSHLAEGAGAPIGFLGATVMLATLVAVLRRRATGAVLLAAAAVLAGLLVSYALAVTSGLPILHPAPEPVTGLAIVTKAVETVGLLAASHLLWRGRTAVAVAQLLPKGSLT
jgi:CHASE2 domain-containing sensor protein